jgi:NADH-quinone oxidoreductase subunit J
MPDKKQMFGWFAVLASFCVPLLTSGVALAAEAAKNAAKTTTSGAQITFYVFAGLSVFGALMTITRKNPVNAALFLVLTLVSTGGIYLSLHATFLAAIQVLVYAGAIMVLFIFVVMSVGRYEDQSWTSPGGMVSKLLGLAAIGALTWRLINVFLNMGAAKPVAVAATYGDVRSMGRLLFSDYLFPFEAISILLLVSIVGAVMVTRKPQAEPKQS